MRAGGRHWFASGLQRSAELEAAYRFAGWLLGQGFANRAALRVALPDVLFEKLLKGPSFQARAPPPMLHIPPLLPNLACNCALQQEGVLIW
jgi:hypothetical protein